ncbi:hypothetical protein D3C80_1708560 [compost metagenome]
MPGDALREVRAHGALLITIFIAQRPVGGFDRQHRDACFIKHFLIGTAAGAFRVCFAARVGGGSDAVAVGNIQCAIAALFRQLWRRIETGVEIQAIAGNQAVEVNHQ